MAAPYATVQTGSGIIASASGTTVIVEAAAADQFGEGATLIVWPSGANLDSGIRNYETMLIDSKSGATLTVIRGTEEDPTGLATFAAGDQVALSFPPALLLPRKQTQVLMVGATESGQGATIDLGGESLGIIGLVETTVKDVNLDGGTWAVTNLGIFARGSFDGSNWDATVVTASGHYFTPLSSGVFFTADNPAPLYAQFLFPRYLRFEWFWGGNPSADIGPSASATVTLHLTYF